MEDRSGHTKERCWRFGVALAVGLVAALLGLFPTQRSVSRPQASVDDQGRQDPDAALACRSDQVRVWHSYGIRRLVRWAVGRAGWVLFVAGLGYLSLMIGISSADWVNHITMSAKATVISSQTNGDLQDFDLHVVADVWFRTRSGRVVRTTIEPNLTHRLARGQKVPIRYDPTDPSQAVYVGSAGDFGYTGGPPVGAGFAYFWAAVWFGLGVGLLLTGPSRLVGIMLAARAGVATPVRLRTSAKMAYAEELPESYGLEWRLLQKQPDVAGDVHILGEPGAGRWLIVRLDDGRLVWPASKAQPVLASARLRLPVVQPSPVESVHLLLASYAQIIDLLGKLPVVVRRPPDAETEWWSFGALRLVVKTLIILHLRRSLAALGSALLRAALLCDDEPDSPSRRIIFDASDKCRALAETLPRRRLLAVFATIATIAATFLSIISPFLLLPHIPVNAKTFGEWILVVITIVLIFGAAPLTIFFRSVRCKRALFNLTSGKSDPSISQSTASVNTALDAYRLERTAFAAAKLPQPSEWESRTPLLISVVYITALAIFLGYVLPRYAFIIISALVALSAIVVKVYRWQRHVHSPQVMLGQPKSRKRSSARRDRQIKNANTGMTPPALSD